MLYHFVSGWSSSYSNIFVSQIIVLLSSTHMEMKVLDSTDRFSID